MRSVQEQWALRYRPRTFKELAGQTAVQVVLHYMIHERVPAGHPTTPREQPTVPAGLLFAGERGTGKTTAARITAAALNCQSTSRRPCTTCDSCQAVAAQSSAAVTELDAASNGLVGDIRKLTEMVSYDIGVPYRVIILDEAHAMSREGFNALLKTLEEPPPDTSFILVTTERSKIPGTVASRCDPYLFRRLTTAAIAGRLRQILESESASVEEALLTEIAVRADGAMRDAVMLLQQTVQAGMTTVEGFAKLHGIRDYAPALLTACAMGRHADMFAQVDKVLGETGDALEVAGQLVHCLRDVLVLHAGGTLAASAATLSARQRLAALLSVKSATAALRVLWDLQTRARVSDPRAALELVMVMCGEVLGAGQRPAPPSRVNGHSGVATVAELREFAVA